MKTETMIQNNIAELMQYKDKLKPKYLRNLRLYLYSMYVSLDQIKSGNLVGYWQLLDGSDYTSTINENVIASCIDSLTSMMAQKITRPYLSGINTTFVERQVLSQAQQYFDIFIDNKKLNEVVTEAFRDSCIFGDGYIYVDGLNKNVEKALPWQVIYRPSEKTYGKITRVLYERKWFPSTLLPFESKEDYVTYNIYYDIVEHIEAHIVNGKIAKILPYNADSIPFINLHYTNPVYGRDSNSVVDLLYGIQMKIHELYETFSEASRQNPAQMYLVPKGSDIKVTALTNRIGQILQYNPIEGVSNPVQSYTPNFIADQYIQAVQMLKNDAYEITGVSKLSAQSQKPSGLDSGRALQTMNDIESERFEVQQRAVINAYVDVIKLCIKVFNPEDLILPEDLNKKPIKWQHLQMLINKTKVTFNALNYLSKDPSTRMTQIDNLEAKGYINKSQAMSYYNIPDTDAAYNYSNNSYNACQEIINEALYEDDYNIPDYIPIDMLKQEIVNTMLSLRAVQNNENISSIEKLKLLYQEACNISNAMTEQQNEQAVQSDENMWQQQLQREAQQIVNQAQAQAEAAAITNASITNNIIMEDFDLKKAVEELIEYTKHLAEEITEIKASIMDELINPIKGEYEQMKYDNALSDWKCKYGEKLEKMNDKLKAIEGEDFDIIKKSFDDFNDREDGMEADEYVEQLSSKLQEQLDAIGKAFGVEPEKIEEVKIETEDGEVKADVEDGQVTDVEKEQQVEAEAEPEVETKEETTTDEPKEDRPANATDTPDNEEENYKYWEEQLKK